MSAQYKQPALSSLFVAVLVVGWSVSAFTQDGFVESWQHRASEAQADQPNWVTPLATTTSRLEQEIRFDLMWRTLEDGTRLANYGGGKGLELIPSRRTEIIIGVPAYLAHSGPGHDGFSDMSFLMKYRLSSANEEHGSYIVSIFLGGTVPTGSYSNGAENAVVTLSVAAGKGWRKFDVQSTFGVGIPTADAAVFGHPIAWNTAFHYRVHKRIWPEVEVNSTFWSDGTNDGKKEVFLTPGIVFGRFPIRNRLGFTAGTGMQIAATAFHRYDHNWIVSLRMPF